MEKPTDNPSADGMSFWEHLDVLRGVLIKAVVAVALCSAAAFAFKDEVFSIILAPRSNTFFTYRLLAMATPWSDGQGVAPFSIRLINTQLAGQFVIHMKMAVCAGLLAASPYVLFLLFRFVAPALYAKERKYALQAATGGYVMFALGVLLCYFLIFPLTLRFLGTYQVSSDVVNAISLSSYTETLLTMSLLMGVVFELPVLCRVLAGMGVLSAATMRRFRKHTVVVILLIAAAITPTSDVFTMMLVALPVWLLYEASILLVARVGRQKEAQSCQEA